MSAEPNYARQCGDPMTGKELGKWIVGARREAREQGCSDVRVSFHDYWPDLVLVEGWKNWPADIAPPNFFLAA